MLDDAALASSSARDPHHWSGRGALALLSRYHLPLIAGLWFVVGLATVFYEWGLNPIAFPAQDEAVVRFAAALIREQSQPFLALPFPDPEDMAHPRLWLAQGMTALPIYAPVALYGYAQLLRFGGAGLLLIAALPAAAMAAFAAGTARLLPLPRRWLALLAPVLGFVSLYWLTRPWMNLSPVLTCLCSAFFFWTLWLDEGKKARWLAAVWLSVAAAAAIRPDYAAFLLVSALLFLIAGNAGQWKPIILWSVIAGACAVAPNLILNKATTGHAFRAVYQLALDREYGADASHGLDGAHGFSILSTLEVLLAPMGIPALPVFTREFKKYLIGMGPAPALLLAQLVIIPLLWNKSALSRICYAAASILALLFVGSRLHDGLFGGPDQLGFLHHSVPRYLAPVFLFAPLPPLLFLGQCRQKWALYLGSALACAVAVDCGYELYVKQPASFGFVHRWVEANTALVEAITPEVPKDAIVYSAKLDKILWSRWRVGFYSDDPEQSASSMTRAAAAGLPVFVLEPKPNRQLRQVIAALKNRGYALRRIDGRHGLYRLDRRAPPAEAPQ